MHIHVFTYMFFLCTESAIQQVKKDLNIPVLSIVRLKHLVSYVKTLASTIENENSADKNLLDNIEEYRSKYGVDY